MNRFVSVLSRGLLIVTCFFNWSHAQDTICPDTTGLDPTANLAFFRARFPHISILVPTRNPYLGGQNQTYACIQAIDQYLHNRCSNDSQFRQNVDKLRIDERMFLHGEQLPCGAEWIGDVRGAATVEVTYGWTAEYCPGWEISQASEVNQWAQLLVSFILPAVVFSFNIPRPRKLRIWEKLLPEDIGNYRVVAGLFGAILAAICVTLDTIVWLMIAFAFAGPLLLSGLYEAQLDKRVVDYLDEYIRHPELPLGLRARILFTILCGNLDMYPAWSDTMDLARHLDTLDITPNNPDSIQTEAPQIRVSFIEHTDTRDHAAASVNTDVDPISPPPTAHSAEPVVSNGSIDESSDANPSPTPDTSQQLHVDGDPEKLITVIQGETISVPPSSDARSSVERGSLVDVNALRLADQQYNRNKTVWKVTHRLKAMLACQYSFGTTIGGPVVFYLGSFIYALLEIKETYGDEDIAEALAFGMWWMIIPHVAAIAGLLLAGNNPNILKGIVSIRDYRYTVGEKLIGGRLERRETVDLRAQNLHQNMGPVKKTFSNLMERVYEAEYMPAWMWDRGRCKQDWLLVLFTDAWLKYENEQGQLDRYVRKGLENFLNDAIMLTLGDWVFLWLFAFLLIAIPCLFGFLTAYYTPEIGVACRALTFLVYMSSQAVLLLLWTYYLTWRDKYWVLGQKARRLIRAGSSATSRAELDDVILELKNQAKIDTTMPSSGRDDASVLTNDTNIAAYPRLRRAVEVLFYFFTFVAFLSSLFTSIGGSLMEVIGIYRNCLCLITVDKWGPSTRDDTFLRLSTNSALDIHEARRHWINIGAWSVVFMGLICYIGWWYQKRLRAIFSHVAERLDGDEDVQHEQSR